MTSERRGRSSASFASGEEEPRRQLGEVQVVVLAAVTWLGALAALPVPPLVGTALGAVAVLARRPVLLILAAALLATGLGHRSVERFVPVAPRAVTGIEVVLLDDPRPRGAGWRATVRLPDGARVEATAHGSAGVTLFRTRVGGRLQLDGALVAADDTPWARSRHLVGRLRVTSATAGPGPEGGRALVEALRDRVVAGAGSLPEPAQPLYLGLVVGEDRFQAPEQQARFAAAGLAHLLAVSGQNVAFALALFRPVTSLLGRRGRLLATLAALAVVAVATRAEPSVLRATVTAGLASWAGLGGHRQSGVRLLGLAVTGLILVDPFMTRSLGFQLSVAASGGILLLAPALGGRLPGPAFLTGPLSVTIAAQAAVTPLLVHRFGPVSLVSIPANVAGGWAAGLVMMWGLTAGVVAGLVGGSVGEWLQLPALAAVSWLDAVAAAAVRLPAPRVDNRLLVVLIAIGIGLRLAGDRPLRRIALVGVAATMLMPAVPWAPRQPTDLAGGGRLLPAAGGEPSVLVVSASAGDGLLDELIAARVLAVDVIVFEAGTGRAAAIARSVQQLVDSGVALAPGQHRIVGARRVTTEVTVTTAFATVRIVPDGDALRVVEQPSTGHPRSRSAVGPSS